MQFERSRGQRTLVCLSGVLLSLCSMFAPAARAEAVKPNCRQAVIVAEVPAGQGFDRVFAAGLRFYLEPLRSGWIVRVLDADAPREAHDYAEVATPPYQSVSPLLISTDWSFRAQDAVAWNPRHFRFAANRSAFQKLKQLQSGALAGNSSNATDLSELVTRQPEALLELLDARFAPGLADQAKMAAAVATHLESTPHQADMTIAPSTLGKLESIKFRVRLNLPGALRAADGVTETSVPCMQQPTSMLTQASQSLHHR